jgi:hypothetical protein
LIEAASWRPKLGPIAVIAADDKLIIQQLTKEKAQSIVELDRLFSGPRIHSPVMRALRSLGCPSTNGNVRLSSGTSCHFSDR